MKLMTRKPLSLDLGLLVLRVTMGGAMITHGWPKFQKLLGGNLQFGDPLGFGPEVSLVFAVLAELICSILIVIGAATRLATIPLIVTMAVAFFIVHGADDFRTKEMALLFLAGFLTLFFTGPGRYGVDKA